MKERIKISHEIPPIYEKCREKFGVEWDKGVIITYGDTVYCKFEIDEFKEVHEGVHVWQQTEMDKDVWWGKYLDDPAFRLAQELEAYGAEVKFIKGFVKNRNRRWKLINDIHKIVSSWVYGNVITYSEAQKLLK